MLRSAKKELRRCAIFRSLWGSAPNPAKRAGRASLPSPPTARKERGGIAEGDPQGGRQGWRTLTTFDKCLHNSASFYTWNKIELYQNTLIEPQVRDEQKKLSSIKGVLAKTQLQLILLGKDGDNPTRLQLPKEQFIGKRTADLGLN